MTLLTEWDPAALARDVLAEARKADLVVADYMLPAALSAGEAAGVPVVALVHTLYAANLDGSGGLHPMGMAGSVDVARHRSSRASACPPVATLRRAPRPVRQRDGDLPGVARPARRPTGPTTCATSARCSSRRAPTPAGGRPVSTTAARSWSPGSGTTPMDELPVLQRVVTALGRGPGARHRHPRRPPRPVDDLDVPDGVQLSGYVRHTAMLPWASAVVTHAGLGTVLAGLPTASRWCASRSGASSPPTPTRWPGSAPGWSLDPTSPPDVIADAIERAVSDLELRAGAARMAVEIDELVQSQAAVTEVERHL